MKFEEALRYVTKYASSRNRNERHGEGEAIRWEKALYVIASEVEAPNEVIKPIGEVIIDIMMSYSEATSSGLDRATLTKVCEAMVDVMFLMLSTAYYMGKEGMTFEEVDELKGEVTEEDLQNLLDDIVSDMGEGSDE